MLSWTVKLSIVDILIVLMLSLMISNVIVSSLLKTPSDLSFNVIALFNIVVLYSLFLFISFNFPYDLGVFAVFVFALSFLLMFFILLFTTILTKIIYNSLIGEDIVSQYCAINNRTYNFKDIRNTVASINSCSNETKYFLSNYSYSSLNSNSVIFNLLSEWINHYDSSIIC